MKILWLSQIVITILEKKNSRKDIKMPKPDDIFWLHVILWKTTTKPLDSLWETYHNIIWYSKYLTSSWLNCKTKFHSFLPCSTISTLLIRTGLHQQTFKAGEGVIFMTGDASHFSLLIQLISVLTIAI